MDLSKIILKRKLLICMALIPLSLCAQQEATPSNSALRKNQPKYFMGAVGLSLSTFRDFATSPLFYTGTPLHLELTRLRMGEYGETEYGAIFDFGTYKNTTGDLTSRSSAYILSGFYSKLYHLEKLSNSRFNTKVGGMYIVTATLRQNPSLQNNSTGSEIFFNLMASVKTNYDITRKESKAKKFLFIKYTAQPRKRSLGFRYNIGLMNSTWRNGYIYTDQSAIINESSFYDGYEFHAFSGIRMSFEFDYTWFMANHNGLRLTYNWDAVTTGGDLDKYNMAFHTISFSLLFNTNNK